MPASVLLAPEGKRLAELYAQGYSVPQIAETLGRSRKAIRTGMRHLGMQPRTSAEGLRVWLRLRGKKKQPALNKTNQLRPSP
jgi:IS30 family transposase